MTRSRFLFFLLSTALVLPLLAGSLFGASSDEADPGEDSLYKYLSVFTDALGLVEQAYVEETDVDGLMAAALDGVTDALDPMAVYVPEDAITEYLAARTVGSSYSGLTLLRERGMIYVLTVQPGSPAEEAGLRQGDLIAELQGRSTRVMPLWEVRSVLADAPGTEIDVQVVRFAETLDASFTLRAFEAPEPTLERHEGVPVLRIPSFGADTVGAVEELVGRIGESDALVIDLRGTAGGEVTAAYGVSGLFAEGELGQLVERERPLETFRAERSEPLWSGRILLLTDRATLGPGEVLAAVLRDKAGAELVGEHTFGHAGREASVELSTGALLFVADAFYTGPDFEPLDEPLDPDVRVADRSRTFSEVELEDGAEDEQEAERPDVVLERALEHLSEPPESEDEAAADEQAA